ncbi:ribosome maturation factor RimM [Natronoflexus pectinivorans]|uniref:Ribosome maturation factor RimM n=1 Tax=Natronoflexus pectinivorans TaxID=682526 RepID=A0A4R2GPC9_9BACT|nr:ribosome maturation factor RimM [Natronoflexus pectinivorans]TCO10888.1 16S rRNA processing protein RimM [Natronoflexus pectinivorans]
MITKSDLLKIGSLAKPHGVSGEILIRILPELIDHDPDPEFLFLDLHGGLVPFEVQSLRIRNSGDLLVILDRLDSEEKVRKLQGAEIYIDPQEIGEPPANDLFNYSALKGFKVIDSKFGEIGVVKSVAEIKNNPVLELEHQGSEVLIPFHEHFITSVDRKCRTIHLETPEGLIDLYLQ